MLYGDNNNWFAAYAFWVLEMYGHPNAEADGRRPQEVAGREPPDDEGRADAGPTTTYKARDAERCPAREARAGAWQHSATPASALVDVRSPAEFNGEILAPPGLQETAQRSGHIPGAANVPWAQAVKEDGTFKSIEDLKKLYGGKGVTTDKDVIAYCRIGERSSHTWFVLKHLLDYPQRAQLRRLLDGVRQHDRRADREAVEEAISYQLSGFRRQVRKQTSLLGLGGWQTPGSGVRP